MDGGEMEVRETKVRGTKAGGTKAGGTKVRETKVREIKKQESKVWLLGAGPGTADLLTRKGERILREAEIVIYDALVGDEILGLIPEDAELNYVGKRSGRHEKSQEEIGELLVQAAGRAKRVVRLKGGDPFIFGRGSEEAAVLRANGIPFEIVPGVTSAAAVPAYCGIPLTHRGAASSFHVITGHGKEGEPVRIDYEALVRLGGTLVFLMSVKAAGRICGGLLEAGMDPATPAAFLQEGATAGQRKVISDLAHLAGDGKRAAIGPPAIIVIGSVCALEESCRWAEELPLFGKKVLVTRPAGRAAVMAERLRAAGAEAVELPSIRLRLLEESKELCEAVGRIGSYQWLALTSPGGAKLFLSYLKKLRKDLRCLSGLKIAVIGRGTAGVMEQAGIFPDYIPERFYTGDLGEGLAAKIGKEERLLILRAQKGSADLTKPLFAAGIQLDDIPLYETSYPAESRQALRARQCLKQGKFDFVTFTSASTVEGFMELLHPEKEELTGFTAVCIGERTKTAAQSFGMRCIMSEIPSMESMVDRMTERTAGRTAE